jgi:hypothetical protein
VYKKAGQDAFGNEYKAGDAIPKIDQGSDPTFQAIPGFEIGVNAADGAYAIGKFEVKMWKAANTYSILEISVSYKPGTTKKSFKENRPVVTISLIGITVYNSGGPEHKFSPEEANAKLKKKI